MNPPPDSTWNRRGTKARRASPGFFRTSAFVLGVPAISFWAAVPHYVSQPPNPKATVALLQRVEDVLDIEVPLGELPAQSEDWEEAVNEMTADDEEIGEYVRTPGRTGRRRNRHQRSNLQDRRRCHRRGIRALPQTARPRQLRTVSKNTPEGGGSTQRPLRLRLQLIALYAGGFLGPFGGGVVASILPEIGDDLGVGPSAAASSLTAYLLPFAALMLVSGTLGTRWGKVRTVRIAYGVYVPRVVGMLPRPRHSRSSLPPGYCRALANAFTTPLLLASLAAATPQARLGPSPRSLRRFPGRRAVVGSVDRRTGGRIRLASGLSRHRSGRGHSGSRRTSEVRSTGSDHSRPSPRCITPRSAPHRYRCIARLGRPRWTELPARLPLRRRVRAVPHRPRPTAHRLRRGRHPLGPGASESSSIASAHAPP